MNFTEDWFSHNIPNFGGTGKHTVNYRMTREGQVDWYEKGNKIKKEKK